MLINLLDIEAGSFKVKICSFLGGDVVELGKITCHYLIISSEHRGFGVLGFWGFGVLGF